MELNALASWQSIGRDLYALGTLQRARRAHQRKLRAIKEQNLVAEAKANQIAAASPDGSATTPAGNGASPARVLTEPGDTIDEVSDMEEVDYTTITGKEESITNDASPSLTITPSAASPHIRIDGRRGARGIASSAAASHTTTRDNILATTIATKGLTAASSQAWPFWPLPQSLQSVIESKKISWRLLFFAYRTVRRLGKGFLVGWGVKALAGQLPALIRSRGQWAKLRPALLGAFDGGHFRMGAFIGGFLYV
jgi:hypothetical protein